jgi:2-polyprenyl-3-methyl-5-hydroxy-6-metoxy-1,4-benzoquinol methylase
MSQEILDKLDVVIGLLQQLVTQREQHAQRQQLPQQQTQRQIIPRSDILIEMVKSPDWPEAVPGDLICTESETDKQERAEGIIEMMLPPNITKFLDFGCGEGHVPEKMAQRASLAVGYDITRQGDKTWEEQQGNFLLTTSLDKVKQAGPYDTILIYDVIDHIMGQAMSMILHQAKAVLAPGGKIYLRTHPWTGRHGGHLYRKLNKAFAHFLLTDDELMTLGVEQDPKIIKNPHPVGSYRHCIQQLNNLQIESEHIPITIDPYFNSITFQQRINDIYRASGAKEWSPEWGYDFCDFVLNNS